MNIRKTSSQISAENNRLVKTIADTLTSRVNVKRKVATGDAAGAAKATWVFPTPKHKLVPCAINNGAGASEPSVTGKILVVGGYIGSFPPGFDIMEKDRVFLLDGTVLEVITVDAPISVEACRRVELKEVA